MKQKIICLITGLIFIINSFIATRIIDDHNFVSSISAFIAIVILIIPIFQIVVNDIQSGSMKMHELAILAILGSCVQGDLKTSACIAFFILFSIIIETRTASGAEMNLETLAKITPGNARRILNDGSEEAIKGHLLEPDDVIRVKPGENILADGTILKGISSINEANITGESLPVDKLVNEHVFAGTSNLSGVIDIKVEKAGDETTIGKVKELILKAQESKLPFVRMVDEYARFYMPIVLMLAGMVLYFNRHEPDGLDRVIALLVATCPIALILATPAAVVASLSAAARLGVLLKDVNDIEAMARINAVIFDKTGTLTTGILEVTRLSPNKGIESSELLATAAAAESGSNHPVAKAVVALAKSVNVTIDLPHLLHEEPGRGVKATCENKDEILVGNLNWMRENDVKTDNFLDIDEAEASGMSLLFVTKSGNPLGWIGLSDKERAQASTCLTDLSTLGVSHIAMISGDRNAVVKNVSDKLNVLNSRGECSPLDKVEYVNSLKKQGYQVAFIGDGVNDGPALAKSNIGIAMGAAGIDVAIESATIALMNNELNRIPFLLRLAKKMKLTIIQNFLIGGIIIIGGTSLSAMGYLSPIVAALSQLIGSILVAMNSAKLIKQGEELFV